MQILLNWLWQGMALALLVALGLRARPAMNAATRERVWWLALIAVAAMPIAHAVTALEAGARPAAPQAAPLLTLQVSSHYWTILIAAGWAAWTMVSFSRLAVALAHVRAAKALAHPFPTDREARLRTWTTVQRKGRRARLVVSDRVHRAAVLGLRGPLIAVAPDTMSRLSDDELDQVAIHEYAHVQRRDDRAIVVQRVISAILGFHPALWWLDRALTTEREVACDDWVVAHTGAPAQYAACLVQLAVPQSAKQWSIAPGAVLSRPQLTTRVARLMDRKRNPSVARSKGTLCVAPPLVAGLTLACVATPLVGVELARNQRAAAPMMSRVEIAAAPALPEYIPIRAPKETSPLTSAEAINRRRRAPRETSSGSAGVPASPAQLLATDAIEIAPVTAPPAAVRAALPRDVGQPTREPLQATNLVLTFVIDRDSPRSAQASPPNEVPWKAAGTADVAIGNFSRKAAVKTTGFFSRFGRSVARAF